MQVNQLITRNPLKLIVLIVSVILAVGCENDNTNSNIKSLTEEVTSLDKPYSAFVGNYARLITRVTENTDSSFIELIGGKYQKVDIMPIEGETNSYKVPNGRVVINLNDDSQPIGLYHYLEKKNSSHGVFAQKVNGSGHGVEGDYIYQGCIIKEENNTLYTLRGASDKLEKLELFEVSPREFVVFGSDEKIEFVLGTDGRASKIISQNSHGFTTFHRADHVANNPSKIGSNRFSGDWKGGGDLAMFWSHDPTVANDSITRCIISFHGGSRNAIGSYEYVKDLSIALGVNNSTMVLAPHFCEAKDGQPNKVLHWTGEVDGDWRKGDNADNLGQVSSFEITDELIKSVVTNCPNLKNIIVVGHSAGGQIVTRYSVGTLIPEELNLNTVGNPSIRFIVSNPSNYMYFSNKRWTGGTWPKGSFSSDESACSAYNESHYQTIQLNDYMSREGLDLKQNVKNRTVIYLMGDQDIIDDPGLDKSCQAMLQGKNRYERGFIYLNHLRDEFGMENVSGHSISVVHGVGHNTWLMYKSYNGLKAIFDYEHSTLMNN